MNRKKKYIKRFKDNGFCKRCRTKRDLTFHHRDPSTKIDSIFSIAIQSRFILEDVIKEIEKCDLLCRDCHSLEHESRRCQPPKKLRGFKFKAKTHLTSNGFCVILTCKFKGRGEFVGHGLHKSRLKAHDVAMASIRQQLTAKGIK